jgi:flagellar assembly FapA-like protein/PilZ domain-containing protein
MRSRVGLSPIDDRIELLVPVPVVVGRRGMQGRRQVVRTGALLARRRPGNPGTDGFDQVGRRVSARPQREARLPQGANTYTSEDGLSLYAACDGEVMLRRLRIEVVPQFVHEGSVPADDLSIRVDTPVFITGSVEAGACVEAEGDVYIEGAVREAEVVSRSGGITVMGNVAGTVGRPSILRAAGEVDCRSVRHGTITTAGNLRLHAEAWQSTLAVGGDLYIDGQVESMLLDVLLDVAGGIFPRIEARNEAVPVSEDRQHIRVATSLQALLALHGTPPLRFNPCTLVEISGAGARCRLQESDQDPLPDTIIQIKFALPNSRGQIQSIGRVVRLLSPGLISLEFLQMSRRDQGLLSAYCLRLLLSRGGDLADRRLRGEPRVD